MVAPDGTVVVRLVMLPAVTVAVVPLNFTVLLPNVASKLVPVIVTEVPTFPLIGLKLVMVGAGIDVVDENINSFAVITPPPLLVLTGLAYTAGWPTEAK